MNQLMGSEEAEQTRNEEVGSEASTEHKTDEHKNSEEVASNLLYHQRERRNPMTTSLPKTQIRNVWCVPQDE